MDTKHRSDRHDQGEQERPKDSKKRYSRGHQRNSKDPERRAHKEPLKAQSRPSRPPAQLPKESLEEALSGHDDYVRRWLAQTESNANEDPALITRQTSSTNDQGTAAHAYFRLPLAAYNSENAPRPTKGKRRHNSSSDSSLLEVPIRSQPQQLKKGEPGVVISQRREDRPTPRKKQKVGSSDNSLSGHSTTSDPPRDIFKKRPRHKTREDRYEPKKKEKKSKKTSEEKKGRKKREKRGDRKKAAKKAGEELMQNFNSKSISQDRLTMRPSHGPGLFNNGRASSPARRRGLPDLAFSEMEFLQQSHTSGPVGNGDNVILKSREKEKRKVIRAQEEISKFFRPNRMPLQEVSSNKAGHSLASGNNARTIYTNQLESDGRSKSYDRSQSLAIPQEQSSKFERRSRLSNQNQAPTNLSPAVSHTMRLPDSMSRLSGKAKTYVSWSESQISPAVTSHGSNLDLIPVSPTPDSVLRSIEDTGIFKDTGIKIAPASRRAQQSSDIDKTQSLRDRVQHHGDQSERAGTTTAVTTCSSEVGVRRSEVNFQVREEPPRAVPRPSPRDGLQESPEQHSSRDQRETADQPATSRTRIIVEHFDPQTGWHEDLSSICRSQQTSAAAMRKETPQEPRPTLLSRDQIAKSARIKMPRRPSTTSPDVHFTEDQGQSLDGQATTTKLITNDNTRDSPRDVVARITSDPAQGASVGRGSDPPLPILQYIAKEPPHSHVIGNMLRERQVESKFSSQQNSQARLDTSFASVQTLDEQIARDSQEGEGDLHRGLPIRGFWPNDAHPMAANRLSSVLEVEPLYMHQLQRQLPPSEHIHHTNPNNTVIEGERELLEAEACLYDDKHLNQDHPHLDEPTDYTEYAQDDNHAAFQPYEEVENMDASYGEDAVVFGREAYHINSDFRGHQLLEDQDWGTLIHDQNQQNMHMYENQELDESQEQIYNVDYYGGYDVPGHILNPGFWQPRHQY